MSDDAPTELVLLVRAWMERRELADAPPEFRALVTDVLTGTRSPAPTPSEVHRLVDERLHALVEGRAPTPPEAGD